MFKKKKKHYLLNVTRIGRGCVPLKMHTCYMLVIMFVNLRLNVYLLFFFD